MGLKSLFGAVAVALGGWLGTAAEAADLVSTINVEGMHCIVCVRKVTGHLQAIPEAGPVKVDVESGQVTVPARGQTAPSPRSLWEAVERAGYKPVQLIGPYGTFNQKPKS